ncbi:Autophagy-related protein 11 domain containing protein [Elaphomyces granulatus]
MSLQIYIAHSGERLFADPVSFASPDALRSWIARNTSIPSQRQILMTARGKNVKLQTLVMEVCSSSVHLPSSTMYRTLTAYQNEIFIYDRQYVSESDHAEVRVIPPPSFNVENPPDTLADQNNLQSWRNLYLSRRTWAMDLAERCVPINMEIQEHNERTGIIHRAVGVALENLKSHVGSLEHKFQEAQTWAGEVLKEQGMALDGWQRALEKVDSIPARKDLTFFGRPSTPKKGKDRPTGTLRDFLDIDEVHRAATQGLIVSQAFARRVDEVEKAVSIIALETQTLLEKAQPPGVDSADGLLKEVETIAKKIASDCEHVLGLPYSQKTLANISRMALGHTKDLLPSLLEISLELKTGLEQAVSRYNTATKAAVNHMHTISSMESRLANIQSQIANLDFDNDVFDILYAVFHMPVIYGSVLIEAVRRHEWSEKMKADSLTLAEEMAVFRDEEQRRRKKWMKSIGDFVSLPDDGAPGIEVNLQGQGHEWPEVTRKEIESYIEHLKFKNSMAAVVQELSLLYADLDNPTRQQRRRAKAFKQGSVFDMGRSSLLIRGDDMVRSLRDEKAKLEERLKGSESRIRKLEDLLHRQTQISRPVSGNFSIDLPTSPASPRPDALSRRSSVSSRRMSSNQSPEDKLLLQRIINLESELAVERETVQRLQREAHFERQSSTDKIQEVQSTKEDLIKNLEAREEERRFLESEAKKLRHRVEEAEEELDRVIDGREREKQKVDERIRQLQSNLESIRANATEEIQKANGQIESLKGDYVVQKERADKLNEQVIARREDAANHEARNRELQSQIGKMENQGQENLVALQAALMNLSPGGTVPADFSSLVKAIEVLSEGLAIHARSSEESATRTAAEKKSLEERLEQMRTETEKLKQAASKWESESLQVQNELSHERSQLSALKVELDDEQSQRRRLQTKTVSQIDAREERVLEISKRLHTQSEKLGRLLEQLGFTLVRQDGDVIVQRASKVNGSSGVGESLLASGIASIKPDPEFLAWINREDLQEEASKFKSFMESIAKFDVDVFSEPVIRRVKDIEMLARKWQKEARGYRDKYHRAQSEAYEKIAYRSFKEGDLALFLPTRNQAIRSWAAFNVGAPHYFLREQDVHKLSTRDWLLARITKVEERVVDLSKSLNGVHPDRRSIGEASDGASLDDENPFELSDGLRWYLLDAIEEKPGAPSTPGLGKSTVASANVDAKGSIRLKRAPTAGNVTKTLTRSLDSRRSSSNSKKGAPIPVLHASESTGDNVQPAEVDVSLPSRETAPIFDEGVERDRKPKPRLEGAQESSSPAMDRDMMSNPASPTKRLAPRSRPWEKLLSVDYRLEGSRYTPT